VPVAGSSAGAIATMSVGCGIEPERVLEATIAISDTCLELDREILMKRNCIRVSC
jgi:hypothetical protein